MVGGRGPGPLKVMSHGVSGLISIDPNHMCMLVDAILYVRFRRSNLLVRKTTSAPRRSRLHHPVAHLRVANDLPPIHRLCTRRPRRIVQNTDHSRLKATPYGACLPNYPAASRRSRWERLLMLLLRILPTHSRPVQAPDPGDGMREMLIDGHLLWPRD